MPIYLTHIKVSNAENNTTWEKQLEHKECQQVDDYLNGKRAVSIIPATFIPVRTNNFENFSKDFFLPTFINHAIKVEHVAGKVFAIFASLILDVLTFPLRLLTCIPRILSNTAREKNFLYNYLIEEGVDEKLLESNHVRVHLTWEQTSPLATSSDGQGVLLRRTQHERERTVNFIDLPTYPNSDYSACAVNSPTSSFTLPEST